MSARRIPITRSGIAVGTHKLHLAGVRTCCGFALQGILAMFSKKGLSRKHMEHSISKAVHNS